MALSGETVGEMGIRAARGPIGDIGVHLVRRENVLIGALLRLLRRVGMRLVGRGSMGRGRLLVGLVRVHRWEACTATKASLREIQAGMRVGAGRPQR